MDGKRTSWVDCNGIKVWDMDKVFTGIHWNASAASKNIGVLLPPLILAADITKAIEVGVANGFTSQVIARGLYANTPNSTLISCDISPNCLNYSAALCADIPITHITLAVDSKLYDWSTLFPVNTVGLIYIDGDHSYDGARGDIETLSPYLAPGGFLVVHDYNGGQPGVVKAVDEFLKQTSWPYIIIPELEDSGDYRTIIIQKPSL